MIPPSYVRVLDAIIRLHQRGERPTILAIADEIGWTGHAQIQRALQLLRIRGLIDYEDRKAATVRPLVKFIPVEDLLPKERK